MIKSVIERKRQRGVDERLFVEQSLAVWCIKELQKLETLVAPFLRDISNMKDKGGSKDRERECEIEREIEGRKER